MPKITTLELEIKQTITNSRNTALEKLATNLNTLKASVSGIEKDLGSVAGAFKAFSGSLENGNTMAANIKKCGAAIKKLIEDSKGADTAATGMAKIADQLERISNASGNASGIKSALSDINKAAATNGARTKPAVDTGKGTTRITAKDLETEANKIPKVKTELKEAAKASTSFGFSLSKAVALGGKLVDAGWDKLKAKVSGLLGPVTNLLHSFGRIAMYRGLRTAIKAITQGFSQGIEHLYTWAGLVDNRFKQSMDSIATSAHYLRDSLGAMASPLLDALAPALEILVDKFVSLLNVANQFFAALTGKTTWRKAVRTPTEWAKATDDATDSTKKATEAQKKLNKALMDFDEIHLLTTSTTKGSNPKSPSSSGGDSGIDSTHFEEVPIASWIQDIKDAIENGDWYGAGKLLADKLNSVLDQWDARAWGQKLGQKIENGLKFFLGFMDNFHWEDLGAKLGQALGGIFDKVSGEDIGNAIIAPLKAGIKIAKGFFNEPGTKQAFEEMGVAAYTAINGIFNKDFAEEVAGAISGAINDAIAFLKTAVVGKEQIDPTTGEVFISGGIEWGDIGKNLVKSLFDTIGSIHWDDLGTVAANIFTGIVTAIGEGISYAATHIGQIAGAIKDFAMAFFKGIWEWFWPSVKEFLFGEHYTAESANDRPNAPVVTGQGAQTTEQLQQELSDTKQWVEEAYGALSNFANLWGWLGKTPVTPIVYATEIEKATAKANAIKKKLDEVAKGTYKPTITYAEKGYTTVTKHLDNIAKTITVPVKYKVSAYTSSVNKSGKTVETKLSKTQLQKVLDLRAAGGFPDQGSLFVAGEMPGQAEMVGNINGKTGVASGKEITGIGDAVRETGAAEAALLREQNQLLRQILAKSGTVTLAPSAAAGRWVSQSQAAYARATGV